MPKLPDTAYIETVPDWICGVLSPATRAYDLAHKRGIYGEYGIGQAWFLNPDAQTLEAFANEAGAWMLV